MRQMSLSPRSRRSTCWIVGFLVSCLAPSCAGPRRAGPVDVNAARQAVTTVLDSWKNGNSLSEFQKRSTGITVQDMDWAAGIQLVSYSFSGAESTDTANLHCSLKLLLRDQEGKETEKQVKYVIGTDPVTTVFREMSM